jgi:hypothetical protein
MPVSAEEKRVDTARRKFYGAYGRLWIALPVSFLAMGIADSYLKAPLNQGMTMANTLTYGAWAVIGLAAVDTVFRIVRYLVTSGSDAAPLARFPESESLQEE